VVLSFRSAAVGTAVAIAMIVAATIIGSGKFAVWRPFALIPAALAVAAFAVTQWGVTARLATTRPASMSHAVEPRVAAQPPAMVPGIEADPAYKAGLSIYGDREALQAAMFAVEYDRSVGHDESADAAMALLAPRFDAIDGIDFLAVDPARRRGSDILETLDQLRARYRALRASNRAALSVDVTAPTNLDAVCTGIAGAVRGLPGEIVLVPKLLPANAPTWLLVRTNLPDNLAMRGVVHEPDGTLLIEMARVPLQSGCMRLGPFPAATRAGTYRVSLFALEESYQPPSVLAVIGPHGGRQEGPYLIRMEPFVFRGRRQPESRVFSAEGTFRVGDEKPAFRPPD